MGKVSYKTITSNLDRRYSGEENGERAAEAECGQEKLRIPRAKGTDEKGGL